MKLSSGLRVFFERPKELICRLPLNEIFRKNQNYPQKKLAELIKLSILQFLLYTNYNDDLTDFSKFFGTFIKVSKVQS